MGVSRTRDCRLCSTPGAKVLFTSARDAGNGPSQPSPSFTYYACSACGVHFLDTVAPPRDVYRLEMHGTGIDPRGDRHDLSWDDEIARALDARVPARRRRSPVRLLDFGSGYGDMLIAAARTGYSAEGVDVSPELAARARELSGCPVFVGYVEDAAYPSDTFEVINAHFALEYVRDLRATMRELARILAPGGLLRVCSSTTDSVPAKLKRASWWNYDPTRPFLFSRRTMDFLADDCGLHVREVIHGGEQSLHRYLVQRPDDARRPLGTAMDWARYHLRRVHFAGFGVGSCRAFYLEKGREAYAMLTDEVRDEPMAMPFVGAFDAV